MSETIRVLIVDDHPLVREGLLGVLGSEEDLEVAGQAQNGEEAVMLAFRLRPDVILMDLLMKPKDGIEATREILQQNPSARILILTSTTEVERVLPAVQAGALGYVTKEAQPDELITAIHSLYQGGVHFPLQLTRRLIQKSTETAPVPAPESTLTEREIEILKLVALGLGNEEIAARLKCEFSQVACLVFAEKHQQIEWALTAGADRVLLRGFSTKEFILALNGIGDG